MDATGLKESDFDDMDADDTDDDHGDSAVPSMNMASVLVV
jgi:hypothetical protein